MKKAVSKSLENIENFLRQEHRGFWGMMQGNIPGAIAKIMTRDRFYFMTIIVDDNLDKVFLDLHPQCVCEEPYRQMVHGYLNAHTSTYKSGRIDIDDDSGEVKIHIETQISDHPVSVADLKDMEHLAIHVSDGLERRLDKLCHGVWFNEDDPKLLSDEERRRKDLLEKLKKTFGGEDNGEEDSDDDTEDVDLSEIGLGAMDDHDEEEGEEDDETDGETDGDGDVSSGFPELLEMLKSMREHVGKPEEPIEAECSEPAEPDMITYRIELVEVPPHVDTDELVKVLEKTLGMSREDTLSAAKRLPCCIAESVSASDTQTIKNQLNDIGIKIRIEKNSH